MRIAQVIRQVVSHAQVHRPGAGCQRGEMLS